MFCDSVEDLFGFISITGISDSKYRINKVFSTAYRLMSFLLGLRRYEGWRLGFPTLVDKSTVIYYSNFFICGCINLKFLQILLLYEIPEFGCKKISSNCPISITNQKFVIFTSFFFWFEYSRACVLAETKFSAKK